jgi:hypothetical protein
MNVLIFAPKDDSDAKKLGCQAAAVVTPAGLETFETLDGYAQRIRRPKRPGSVSVIVHPSWQELKMLAAMRDLTAGTKTLLILSDQRMTTVSLAHRIFPSYIAYGRDAVSNAVAVLKQLASKQKEALRDNDVTN